MWNHSTFSKNRERLLDESLLSKLFESVLAIARRHKLLSSEHFSVDGSLIDAWASHKSFKPKDDDDEGGSGGKERDFRDERRSNETHESTTDPEAQLMRKGNGMEARLRYGLHHVMENRNHLVVGVKTTPAASVSEREAALALLKEIGHWGSKKAPTRSVTGRNTVGAIESQV